MNCCKLRRTVLLFPLALGADGKTETVVNPKYLAKGDIDRVLDAARAEVFAGLHRFAEKMYRRNPREFKKGNAVSIERRSTV